MTTPIWGKPKAKKGKDLFWGLPDGPKSRYPYNELYDDDEWKRYSAWRRKLNKITQERINKGRKPEE